LGGESYGNALMKNNLWLSLVICIILLLTACSSPEVYSSAPLSESRIFVAEGVDNARIQFIWLELPDPITPGQADARLFLAKTEPPEPIAPTPNELRCELSSGNEYAILGPERVPFEFMGDGTFVGSYAFMACPECIECYMNWETTLEITGAISQETVTLDIAIKHLGVNVQGSFVSVELELASNTDEEPRITCNNMIECQEIFFITRE
jgi:hypothetical protein